MHVSSSVVRWGGYVFDVAIRIWLRCFGRRIDPARDAWIGGATGTSERIGPEVYDDVARQMGLQRVDRPSGLMADFETLRGPNFDPDAVHADIRDFYENTSAYTLDAWASWSRTFRPLARILVGLISRRVDQLNLPVRPLDTAPGMRSDVIPLVDAEGTQRAAGWLRRLVADGTVVYAGIYEIVEPPRGGGPCVKTVFPLPRGNVIAVLRPEAVGDGSFRLVSKGSAFGEPGMHRSLVVGDRRRRIRYIRAMHESIHVFVDEGGQLRTDHRFMFFGHVMLHIHYRITAKDRVISR
jgi:hypothetical protein